MKNLLFIFTTLNLLFSVACKTTPLIDTIFCPYGKCPDDKTHEILNQTDYGKPDTQKNQLQNHVIDIHPGFFDNDNHYADGNSNVGTNNHSV